MNEQKEVKMGENKNTDHSMSLSKQRKLNRKKEIAQMKRNKKISKIVTIVVSVVLIAGIGSLIGYQIYRNATKIVPSSNYSLGLNDNGFIEGVKASDYVDLVDYKNIKVPADEVAYTDEDLAADIKTLVYEKATLSTDTDAAIVDGDKINIDYVGTVDGKEFEGGNTEDAGADLTIGSGEYVDDFEQQLIGHKIGDVVTVDVTFPDDYSNAELASKDAIFEVTINGIYIAPEFDDAFVKENYSTIASTAEEYKSYLKSKKSNEKLDTWVSEYLFENSTVTSYPEDYMGHLKSVQKYYDQSMHEYMNSFYSQMGYAGVSFAEYVGKSEAEYDKSLDEAVQPLAKEYLIYQAILEQEGLTATEEEYIDYLETEGLTTDNFTADVEQFGKGYVMQEAIRLKVLETLKGYITVE